MHQLKSILAHEVLATVPQHARDGRVFIEHDAIRPDDHDAVRHAFHQRTEMRFTALQRFLRALPVGDVPIDAILRDVAIANIYRRYLHGYVNQSAIAPPPDGLNIDVLALQASLAQPKTFPEPGLGDDQRLQLLTENVFTRMPEEDFKLAVRPQNDAFFVNDHDGLRSALKKFFQIGVLNAELSLRFLAARNVHGDGQQRRGAVVGERTCGHVEP